jgi:hypothetical protein
MQNVVKLACLMAYDFCSAGAGHLRSDDEKAAWRDAIGRESFTPIHFFRLWTHRQECARLIRKAIPGLNQRTINR